MDINSVLGGVECSCGKKHRCNIDYVYVEKGAASRLEEICAENKSILVIADENTFTAAGGKVIAVLGEKISEKIIFSGKTVLIPDEKAIGTVTERLDGIDLIIGIGSGVIQDLCKYVSFFNKIPYVIVATAPSMDGYASDGAAMILKGMKETVPAGPPRAIVADTEVLKAAPMEMIKAGYGDIIGKLSALCDWRLSAAVNGEYFCPYIYKVTFGIIENTLNTAKGLLKRDEESVKTLMEALVCVGIMMSFAGSSRPASGSEHHLSHFFEITGIVNNEKYLPHGIDVAYSTAVTVKLREEILKRNFPEKQFCHNEALYEKDIKEIYKSVADECISLQKKAGLYSADRAGIYKQKEAEIRNILSEMPSSSEIIEMLERAELDINEFYRLYGSKKINDAVRYAKDLKNRYTVLWLNYDMFGGEEFGY